MWLYEGKVVEEEQINSYWGFVYKITRLATQDAPERIYIGRKQFTSTRKKKLTKKELAEWSKPGKKPTHKKVTSVSDWEKYWGSDDELKADVKKLGEDKFIREIIHLCATKKKLSYYEENLQHSLKVLENPHIFYNKNIAGKYFIKDLL